MYHCHYLLQCRMLRMFSAHLFLGGSLCHQTLCLIEVGSSNTEHYSVARHLWIEISLNIDNHICIMQFLISYTGIHTNTHTRKHYWTLKAMLTGVCCVRVRVRVRWCHNVRNMVRQSQQSVLTPRPRVWWVTSILKCNVHTDTSIHTVVHIICDRL